MRKKILKITNHIAKNPIEYVEFILAIGLVIFGLYAASPFYVVTSSSTLSMVFDHQTYRIITGVILTLPGIPVVYWQLRHSIADYVRRQKQRKNYIFYMSLCYFYLTALRLVTIGITPVIWLFTLALSIIAVILYLRLIR